MANGIKPTKNQHFIPQMYLRGFSEIKKSGKALIWQYNLNTMQQTPVQVDVQDIFLRSIYMRLKVVTVLSLRRIR